MMSTTGPTSRCIVSMFVPSFDVASLLAPLRLLLA